MSRWRNSEKPANPLAARQRATRREEVVGVQATCVRCGYRVPVGLRRIPKHLFERHHPEGRHHNPELTVVVCANCHAILSEGQRNDDVMLSPVQTDCERLVAVVGALGSHLRELGESLLAWSRRGRTWIQGLDKDYPGWRDKPWAK